MAKISVNGIDVAGQFSAAMSAAGLTVPRNIIADGRLHRFAPNGKGSDDAGWYVLHSDSIPAGAFGDWRSGLEKKWCADVGRRLTDKESAAIKALQDNARKLRQAESAGRMDGARNRAIQIWENAKPATADHPYLKKKGIKSHGTRMHEGRLVIPIRDSQGKLLSLQFIDRSGTKRFLAGGAVAGGFHELQPNLRPKADSPVLIAEGFATAASLCKATRYRVVAAFSAGNLPAVARAIRGREPGATLILCADNDVATAGNPGVTKAKEAARAIGALLAIPEPCGEAGTDFNDLAEERGLGAVIDAIVNAQPMAEAEAAAEPQGWPPRISLTDLGKKKPSRPEFIMTGLPVGYATGCFGHGGVGKSGIELMRAACIASGKRFHGMETEQRRVLYLSCEDRRDVLHWRLARICEHLHIDLASLDGWLSIIDLVGHDAVLFSSETRGGGKALTAAYGLLAERINEYGSEVVFVDGISDAYGGNENARGEVKRFVNSLVGLIPPKRGAVILIGHIDKAAARMGAGTEGYSGSTAWHNSVRARWYLRPMGREGDEEQADRAGKLVLELQKSNFGDVGTQIELEWDSEAHLHVGTFREPPTERDRAREEQEARAGIIAALRECSGSNTPVPAARSGGRTAYHVLFAAEGFPKSLKDAPGRRRFWKLIEGLIHSGAVIVGSHKKLNRHVIETLELAPAGRKT